MENKKKMFDPLRLLSSSYKQVEVVLCFLFGRRWGGGGFSEGMVEQYHVY